MKTNTYYGEYSLKHWLKLIITGNITLPAYQRNFVWQDSDIKRLIKSLSDNQFIQPITIAKYKDNTGKDTNLILDGQQRLTSVLLAYCGIMPNKTKFNADDTFASEDDSANEEDNQDEQNIPIGWTFHKLLNDYGINCNSIEQTKGQIQRMENDNYLTLDDFKDSIGNNIDVDEQFLEEHFIGFSYIVPDMQETDTNKQKFFSTLFRNMNYLGHKLSAVESRRSLYFMNTDLINFLDGKLITGEEVLCGLRIQEYMTAMKIDIVKYLAILSQYHAKNKNLREVLKRYSSYGSREDFYADYVSYLMNLEQSSNKEKFEGFNFQDTIGNDWKEKYIAIYQFIKKHKASMLGENETFSSWIDVDFWLFGLINCYLFANKSITDEIFENIRIEIANCIQEKEPDYKKAPNQLGRIRERIEKSIEIYNRYAE